MLSKLFRSHLQSRYDRVAGKITGMIKELDTVVKVAEDEEARLQDEINELAIEQAGVRRTVQQATKFRENLNKLFE